MRITTLAEQTAILESRSLLYSFISALFSIPGSEKFEMLHLAEYGDRIRSSTRYLDQGYSLKGSNLEGRTKELFGAISDPDSQIQEEYIRVFGHTLSKDTSPYELEHLKNKEVFSLTQSLADIQGFYRAFGLEVEATERADHIAIEAEFLSYVILKEVIAIKAGQAENMEVCRDAQRDFWKDHFSWWVARFAENLLKEPTTRFYREAALLIREFLEQEEEYLT